MAQSTPAPPAPADPPQLGALAPSNIAKPRPKPPFDITGTWLHAFSRDNPFTFSPPPGFKLTPEAQVQYDAAKKARAEGKAYHDDIGQCWPAGLPVIMTRVWPIAMIQKPTAIFMVSGFMNSTRIIYLDGRKHTDPDLVIPSFNGESIGHWEGDTLVVDTVGFRGRPSLARQRHPRSATSAHRGADALDQRRRHARDRIHHHPIPRTGWANGNGPSAGSGWTTPISPKRRACRISTRICRA